MLNVLNNDKFKPSTNSLMIGTIQALFISPSQRLKVFAITYPMKLNYNTTYFLKKIIKDNGILSLYRGFVPIVIKKSLDWSAKLYTVSWLMNNNHSYVPYTNSNFNLSSGILVSSIIFTTPLDVLSSNIQKYSGNKWATREYIKEIHKRNL